MNKKPLLTIAIPTFNRANTLYGALTSLLPQIVPFRDDIEIVISDNASTDNTENVLKTIKEQYNDLNIVVNQQLGNTGYFGNFKKCRELSNGKWFWLLSDNDYVNSNLIEYVINTIKENDLCSVIFLKDWDSALNNTSINANYKLLKVSKHDLVKIGGYKITLISAIIIANNKEYDKEIFKYLKGNPFLGFSFLLATLSQTSCAIIVEGKSLMIKPASISFNVFKSFAIDLIECISFARTKGFVDKDFEETLLNSIINNLTKVHYTTYKLKRSIYGHYYGEISKIEELLTSRMGKYKAFEEVMYPLFMKSRIELFIGKYFNKINKLFIREHS